MSPSLATSAGPTANQVGSMRMIRAVAQGRSLQGRSQFGKGLRRISVPYEVDAEQHAASAHLAEDAQVSQSLAWPPAPPRHRSFAWILR